jgi:HlyD family secretion protein
MVLVAGAAGGGAWYWLRPGDAALDYQTVTVSRGSLTQVVTASGTLNPVLNVQVGSQISGMIQKLYADFNTQVKAGDLIAQLDPSSYKATVLQNEGDLANAKANLELAQVEAVRAGDLFKNNYVSKSEYDKAIATLHQAESQVMIKEGTLQRAKVDLARCSIYAPVDGIVISRNVDVGQTVAASLSAPTLYVIANDLAKMQIDANVAEADVGGVEVGQDVDFTVDAFPYRTFRGKVTQVRNAATTVQNVVTYDAVIEVDNADLKLKPGMTANVSIIIARRDNVIKIPNAALRFRPPDSLGLDSKTNTPASGPTAIAAVAAGAGAGPQEGAPTARPGRGERGAGRGPGMGPGAGRARPERSPMRTIYVMPKTDGAVPVTPKAVQIKTGISDSVTTEVIEGLNEGDTIITGVAGTGATVTRPASSPFGGGGMRRF